MRFQVIRLGILPTAAATLGVAPLRCPYPHGKAKVRKYF